LSYSALIERVPDRTTLIRDEERDMTDYNEEFLADPTGHLVAVVDDHSDAEAIEEELRAASFEQVHVYRGRGGAETIDSSGADHGVSGGLVRGVQQAFSNKDNLAEYEQAVRKGSTVIAVRVEDDAARDRAIEILERHSAHDMNHFGAAVVRTITP
jgi:hypothetical protein